jgi:hypothetical protein
MGPGQTTSWLDCIGIRELWEGVPTPLPSTIATVKVEIVVYGEEEEVPSKRRRIEDEPETIYFCIESEANLSIEAGDKLFIVNKSIFAGID